MLPLLTRLNSITRVQPFSITFPLLFINKLPPFILPFSLPKNKLPFVPETGTYAGWQTPENRAMMIL